MTADATARLALPFLAAGQAQKELSHNEALALIDLLLCASVEATDAAVPPGAPSAGQAWLLGAAPTAAWAGHAQAIAGWTDGGWRFVEAVEGLRVRVRETGLEAVFSGGVWQLGTVDAVQLRIGGEAVVGPRQPAVPDPAGGAVIDSNARETIGLVLSALRRHGLISSD